MQSRAHMGESIAYLDAVQQDWGWRRWGPEQAERVGLLKESWRQSSPSPSGPRGTFRVVEG